MEDSSVYPTLISSIPRGCAITKMECANHCVKCYRTALERLVQDKPSYEASFSSPSTSEQTTVEDTILEQAEFWNDATDEDNSDGVREILDSSPTDLDEAMICDIQHVVSRLAEKVPQLIGKLPNIYKQHVKLTYVHFRKFHN